MIFYVVSMVIFILIFKAKHFVFVDETGLNREYRRLYARAKRGVKIHDKKSGKRQKSTNIIGALWGDKHIALKNYEHSTTSVFFACSRGRKSYKVGYTRIFKTSRAAFSWSLCRRRTPRI